MSRALSAKDIAQKEQRYALIACLPLGKLCHCRNYKGMNNDKKLFTNCS
jgi:hypothetical protein